LSWNFLASSSSDRGFAGAAAVDLDAGLAQSVEDLTALLTSAGER
jgi:hypothetical protein